MENMQSQPPTATTFCPVCTIHLSYPAGSSLIQCPACQHTIDPNVPQQTRCVRCDTLLAYPPNSLFIQCPKCMETMDPRSAAIQRSRMGPMAGGPMAPGGMPNMGAHHAANLQAQQQKQSKKRRDPNAPKAVSNAYMIFCKARRAELKSENPDLPFGKIGARLGEIWRTMTPEQKKPYEDKATTDRERYRKEMLDYQIGKHQPDAKKLKTGDGDEDDEEDLGHGDDDAEDHSSHGAHGVAGGGDVIDTGASQPHHRNDTGSPIKHESQSQSYNEHQQTTDSELEHRQSTNSHHEVSRHTASTHSEDGGHEAHELEQTVGSSDLPQ